MATHTCPASTRRPPRPRRRLGQVGVASTICGPLPAASIRVRFIPAARTMASPVPCDPTNPIASTPGASRASSPASLAPYTMPIAPSGSRPPRGSRPGSGPKRRELARLQDDRVPGRKRRGDQLRRDHDREVPRRDHREDAVGLSNVKTTFPRRSLGITAVSIRFTSSAAIRRLPAVSCLLDGLGPQRLALLERQRPARGRRPAPRRCRRPGAGAPPARAPSSPRAAAAVAGGPDGRVDLARARDRDLAELLAGCRASRLDRRRRRQGAAPDCRTVAPTPLEPAPAWLSQARERG